MRKLLTGLLALCVAAGLAGSVLADVTVGDYVKASNPGANEFFGHSVALDGNTMVVGAIYESGNGTSPSNKSTLAAGAAYVFVHENGVWRQQAFLKAPSPTSAGYFGGTVDISGDTLIVSQVGDALDFPWGGSALIFVRDGESWTLQATLRSSQPSKNAFFGGRVAIDGNTALVSETQRKMVTVYVRNGTTWTRQQDILLNNGDIASSISSIDISGDTLVAGSANKNQAYVYTRTGSTWTQQATLTTPEPTPPFDNYGKGVKIEAGTIVVGAKAENRAYVYTLGATGWTLQTTLVASNRDLADGFGEAVNLFGDRIVVGAPSERSPANGVNGDQGNDAGFIDSGAAYVFRYDGVNWAQEAYLKASNNATSNGGERFGNSVAISDKFVAIGAAEEWGGSSGVNGNQADRSRKDSGAVYTFNLPQNDKVSWANAAGGSWDEAANWNPAVIPGVTTDVLFNLPDTYDVLVGDRQVANADVQNGSVGFKGTELELTGSLRVSNQAYLTLPEVKVQATETLVGFLPPADPANPLTAHLNVFNSGTFFTSTVLRVGSAAPGEMFVSNGGRLNSTVASIGSGAYGAVVIGGEAQWLTDSLELTGPAGARLTIETGSLVLALGDAVVGGQATDPQENAAVVVDIAGRDAGGTKPSHLDVEGQLVVGDGSFASIFVREAAQLSATNLVSGARSDGQLWISEKSSLVVRQDLTVGQDGSGNGLLSIRDGSLGEVSVDLTVGENTSGYVNISGTDAASGFPSELSVSGECIVGMYGEGTVNVAHGGRLQCGDLYLGTQSTGIGILEVGNDDGPGFVETGVLAIALEGEGSVVMQAGVITAEGVTVFPDGEISGTGKIVLGEEGMLNQGTITVGSIDVTEGTPFSSALTVPFQPSTLEIDGDLVMTESSRLVIEVAGDNPAQHHHLVVNGELTMGGQLVLNFTNGYVPADGEVANFLQVDGVNGSFDEVVINGLPEGFTLEEDFVGLLVGPSDDGWPAPFNGVKPDASLGLELNNISYFYPQDGLIYTCINVLYNGVPGAFAGYFQYDIAFEVVSLANAVIGVNKYRTFNETNALNEDGELPDCSGSIDLVTNVYSDYIQVDDLVYDVEFLLTDGEKLHFTASRVTILE